MQPKDNRDKKIRHCTYQLLFKNEEKQQYFTFNLKLDSKTNNIHDGVSYTPQIKLAPQNLILDTSRSSTVKSLQNNVFIVSKI